ncbi:hypothetical protein AvCA_12300 [Azotobacter vinelandii CA]|uniref:Uncharacterized protein n=2 Tax=Azotobacter vinelandii TaxID=354 RepID=C1DQ05_AZOVD|nr:hypothetical protein Avin_12300 [Azotobacter vinelandii DJ]AGK15370.1 hypothetical protein AvCA_12300 [Azotobacter vinelandii CA]AGK19804.1 hypothetical protein AvCA6_12300 [Azotobacter vinelandii CA6]
MGDSFSATHGVDRRSPGHALGPAAVRGKELADGK